MENNNNLEGKKSTYTPAAKKALYKWRETHIEDFRKYSNKFKNENYYKNAEKYKENFRKKYRENSEKYKEYALKKYREKQEGKEIRLRGRPKKIKDLEKEVI